MVYPCMYVFLFVCCLKNYIVYLLVFKYEYFAQRCSYHSSCIQWRITWVTLEPPCQAECQVTFAPSYTTSSDRMIWGVLYEFKKGCQIVIEADTLWFEYYSAFWIQRLKKTKKCFNLYTQFAGRDSYSGTYRIASKSENISTVIFGLAGTHAHKHILVLKNTPFF